MNELELNNISTSAANEMINQIYVSKRILPVELFCLEQIASKII